jgi:integrase
LAKDLIRSGQERTAEAYRTVSRGLIRFNKGKDIPLKHINANLIKNFERDMKAKGKSLNTISYYMRNLRAIYNKAIRDKQIEAKAVNPFSDVFTGFKKTRKRALSLDELKQLDRLDFLRLTRDKSQGIIPDACLSKAWRIFFFCFYARGMNFVDMAYLRKENIRGGVISYYRKKTGQLIEIKLTPVLQELIDSFSRDVKFSPYVFPVITDPDKPARRQYQSALRLQNIYLKKLCKLAGVKSKVTTHVTRHSWATIAKEENLPIWVISEGLGHSNEKMTYTYLASFDRSVLDQASEIVNEALQHSCSKIA